MEDDRAYVKWSPRVPKSKLRRLYQSACQGVWDEALIDDVGMTLYLRCQDILKIHRAWSEKQIACPKCENSGAVSMIPRRGRDAPMTCPLCGWTMTWFRYHRTFQRRQLNPGGAVSYFQEFLEAYTGARDPKTRMLAIDRVIHEFHYSMRDLPDQPSRSAGVNLIEGRLAEVLKFLNELSEMDLPGAFRETSETWRKKQATIKWDAILEEKRRKEGRANRETQSAP
jgi:hypothetical protein